MPLALAALVVAATASLWGGPPVVPDTRSPAPDAFVLDPSRPSVPPALATDGMPLWARQSPPVVRPDYIGTVQFEVVYLGSFSHLRVFQSRNGGTSHVYDEYPLVESRTLQGRTVSVFRPSWTMGEFIRNFGLVIDVDGGKAGRLLVAPSSVPLGPNGAPTIGDYVDVLAMSRTVGSVPVVQIDATAQYSSHVVNLVIPGMSSQLGPTDQFDSAGAAQRFYSYFGDDYESLAFLFREQAFNRFIGAGHAVVQNKISGIGLQVFDASAAYGSAGRLEAIETWYHPFETPGSNHEITHQWADYIYWIGILAGLQRADGVHYPLMTDVESPLASLLAPNLKMRALNTGEWESVMSPPPTKISPLQAYAMGLVPASAVPPMDVFENQLRPAILQPGQRASGPVRRVTIDDVIAYHGPRVGPVVTSLRRATVLLSRDALATPDEMAFWTLMAQRMEDPYQTGMIRDGGIGSFRAISGVPLHTRIIPPPGGPVLPGHTLLEPAVLDVRDMAGVVLDSPPKFELDGAGVLRVSGRITAPELAGASRIAIQNGGSAILSSTVAPDGRFTISGSPNMAPGWYGQRLFVTIGGLDRNIAGMRHIRYHNDIRVPPPPVGLDVRVNNSSVAVAWAPDTGSWPTHYFLDVGSSPGATDIGTFPMNATQLTAPGVPNGRYYLRVRAANSAGVSAPSAEAVANVGVCGPPLPPSGLGFTLTGSTLALAWQPSPSAGASYTIVAGSVSGAGDIAQAPVGVVTSLSVPGVPPGRYFIRVRAVTSCGAADSNEISVIVGAAQVPGPPGTLAFQVAGSTVNLSWSAAAGAVSGYVLEAGSRAGASDLVVAPVGLALALSAPGVPSGTYFVRVRAVNAVGQGPPSNEVVVQVP